MKQKFLLSKPWRQLICSPSVVLETYIFPVTPNHLYIMLVTDNRNETERLSRYDLFFMSSQVEWRKPPDWGRTARGWTTPSTRWTAWPAGASSTRMQNLMTSHQREKSFSWCHSTSSSFTRQCQLLKLWPASASISVIWHCRSKLFSWMTHSLTHFWRNKLCLLDHSLSVFQKDFADQSFSGVSYPARLVPAVDLNCQCLLAPRTLQKWSICYQENK